MNDKIVNEIIYFHELKCDNIVNKDIMYVRIDDLHLILNNEICTENRFGVILSNINIPSNAHSIIKFINTDLYNNIVELFDNIENKLGIFVKVNTKNINIGKKNNKYFTFDKLEINDIIEIKKMKSLKTYIESIEEEKIFETLLSSIENKKFKEILTNFIGIDNKINIEFGSNSKIKDSFIINTNKELSNMSVWNELESLCNLCGYKLNENKLNENKWEYIFTPYHGELANDIIYSEYNGIVYHLTSEYWYNKIKDKKFIPFRSEFGIEGKSRLYCWVGKFNKNLEREIISFKHTSEKILNQNNKIGKYYEKNILLEIDLNNIGNKLDFYYDPNYKTTAIATYTKDNIPVNCITKIYKVNEFTINKNFMEV